MVPLPPEALSALGLVAAVLVAAASGRCPAVFASGTRPSAADRSRAALVGAVRRSDWRYVGLAAAVTLVGNLLATRVHVDRTVTDHVYELEGPTVAAFQSVTTVVPEWAGVALTGLSAVAYLVGFPFVVLLTYFALRAHDAAQARRYAVAYCALVAVAVPLAVLFPVDAPGLYLLDVRPLLLAFDPAVDGPTTAAALVGATPSLTTGLSVLAALYARNATDAFARAVAALAGAVVLSALYLGVHWLTDAAAAAALAVCVYWLTQRVDPDRLDPVARVGSR